MDASFLKCYSLAARANSLHRAAWLGDVDKVRELLEHGKYDVNCKDGWERTPLHYACVKGHLDVVKVLISKFHANMISQDVFGTTPLMLATGEVLHYMVQILSQYKSPGDVRKDDSNTALHYACAVGDLDLVKTLVHHYKANVDAMNEQNNTPVHIAALHGKEEVTLALIEDFYCDASINGYCKKSLLHQACLGGNMSLVRTLIQKHKAYISAQDKDNNMPIHNAAHVGQVEVVLALINDFGCDVSSKGRVSGSVLHAACVGGNVNLIRALIRDHKLDINARDGESHTPVHMAALHGNGTTVLNEFNCDITIKGSEGRSLLHYACEGDDIDLIRTLITKYNVDINARDDQGNTPVHKAALLGDGTAVLTLINEFSCDITIKGFQGRSLLHSACEGCNIDLIRTLITKYNVDINAQDDNGATPVNVAALCGQDIVALALIKEFNCDITIRTNDGCTLPHLACQYPHANVITAISKYVSPLVVDNHGNTPLHICSQFGNLECLEVLLALNAPLFVRNNSGKTPRDVATDKVKSVLDKFQKENRAKLSVNYKAMQDCAKKKYSKAQPITRVFVIGHPGAGKSSFVESLKREGLLQSFFKVSAASVPLHTAGIIPSVHISKHYGRVLFYDFAGDAEYYSSHAAILESLASSQSGDNIFVIVVDLREDEVTIRNLLHFWSSFVENQKFSQREPCFIAIGSHLDLITDKGVLDKKTEVLKKFIKTSNFWDCAHFMMDCCKPGSRDIEAVQKYLISLTKNSPHYKLSFEASILLGLLEKDFSNVTACPVSTIASHIEDTGVPLPSDTKSLCLVLEHLHDIGVLLVIGDKTEGDVHVVLNTSTLTNEVHKTLFSIKEDEETSVSTGIIPKSHVKKLLPQHITPECLIKLQYCQEIHFKDIEIFSSVQQFPSMDESFLFFPALCKLNKRQVTWATPSDNCYTIGWFAECINSRDHFPPRFFHILLLRLVYRFTLSAHQVSSTLNQSTVASSSQHLFQRRCTVWKTGVHWLMEERVECMVELVKDSNGVVVIIKSEEDVTENCISVFNRVVNCVMEAKAEFCHSIRPEFFLLSSTEGEDYLKKDNLFAMSDVERVLTSPQGKEDAVVSIGGKSFLKRSKFLCMRKLTHWDSLFPIEFTSILHHLRDVVRELFDLGIQLKLPEGVLRANELAYFPKEIDKWRRETVRWWMSLSVDPPCWLHLITALRNIDFNILAEEIEKQHGVHIKLQRKLLDKANESLTPDDEFLESLSEVVGSKWPTLASLLSLSSSEIEEIKKKEVAIHALFMLKKWASKRDSTYGLLCQRLKTISLFQNH